MKVIKVTYTVQPSFVGINKENINHFIGELKRINDPDWRYQVFEAVDGKTFMHFAEYNSDEAQQRLLSLPAFVEFQRQRDQHLETTPVIESLQFVDATHTLFN